MRLYGKRSVVERLVAAPQTIRALYIRQDTDAAEVVQAAQKAGVKFTSVNKADFSKMEQEVHAQGILAEVNEFAYKSLEDLVKQENPPTLFMLDRVTDPQNLGNILRTLACLGGFAVVLPKHDSVTVGETVLRVACGAENYVPVAMVTNLVQACELAKKFNYWIAGAAASGGQPIHQTDLPHPLGLVLGSEGTGIRPGLAKHLDLTVTLPMQGANLSFNVATAAALIAYEIIRSKPKEKK